MPLSVPADPALTAAEVWAHTPNRRLTNLADARAALIDLITALRMAELDPANVPGDIDTLLARLSAARATLLDNLTDLDVAISSRAPEAGGNIAAILAGVAAIPTTPVLTAHFDDAVFEREWSTDPIVDNKASAAEETLSTHTIAAADFVYPDGASEVKVILLAMITAAAQAAPTNPHHIGLKVQLDVNNGFTGGETTWDFTANPPLTLAADGAMGPWTFPIDISALVTSGDKLEFRFVVDSDDAASVNYTTSFLVVLVYTMG